MITLELPFGHHKRRVRIYVPARVEPAPPLLLLFDGQNVFDDAGSYAGGWHAHTAIDKLPGTVRRPILVGVDHGHQHRATELTHGLPEMLAFMLDTVVPVIHARFDVDHHHTVIGGSSLGGLASLLAFVRHPSQIAGALVMSPSLWVGRGAAIREVAGRSWPTHGKLYLDVGLRERGAMATLAQKLAIDLEARLPSERLMWRPDRQGTHREKHWRRRLPKALRFLFRR